VGEDYLAQLIAEMTDDLMEYVNVLPSGDLKSNLLLGYWCLCKVMTTSNMERSVGASSRTLYYNKYTMYKIRKYYYKKISKSIFFSEEDENINALTNEKEPTFIHKSNFR
jgi:hypothetical protein